MRLPYSSGTWQPSSCAIPEVPGRVNPLLFHRLLRFGGLGQFRFRFGSPLRFHLFVGRSNRQLEGIRRNVEDEASSNAVPLILAPLRAIVLRHHFLDRVFPAPLIDYRIDFLLRVFVCHELPPEPDLHQFRGRRTRDLVVLTKNGLFVLRCVDYLPLYAEATLNIFIAAARDRIRLTDSLPQVAVKTMSGADCA